MYTQSKLCDIRIENRFELTTTNDVVPNSTEMEDNFWRISLADTFVIYVTIMYYLL